MSLTTGTRLGPYEILGAIGAGGMGEVYRAKDTRLDRIIAIKILPSHLSENAQLKQRFEREARMISSLTHPHICTLYDIGHQDGVDYLVMEYIEGETLSRRLGKGALPAEQVLRYGIQIAEALDRAHRQGVVHRDLKPGNVMITRSGAKLLDFGLAKYSEQEAESHTSSELETRDKLITEAGTILGTMQYMSPEQLEGKESDARTDIFALGEILYEMATACRTFNGTSKASLISSILTTEPPPISTVQPLSPPALDHVIKKCLAKDPEDRWQSAHDVAGELRWISEETSQSKGIAPTKSRRKLPASFGRIVSAALLLACIGIGMLAYHYYSQARLIKGPGIVKLVFPLPEATTIGSPGAIVMSPDGTRVAFCVTNQEGNSGLWLRSFDSFEMQELPRTQDAAYPFWSPDSRFIAFFAEGKLKKIEITGGPPQTLCDAPLGRGGTWNQDGMILFAPGLESGLLKISSGGGVPTEVTSPNASRQEGSHRWPHFLPDGKHFIFTIASSQADFRGLYVGNLDSKETKRVFPDQTKSEYALSGHILLVREKNLVAIPFDLTKLEARGNPISIAEDLDLDPGLSTSSFSVSKTNTLVFMHSGSLESILEWVDRSGKTISRVGQPSIYFQPTLSPNEKSALVGIPDAASGGYDIWQIDLVRGTFSRLTSSPSTDTPGVFSADGSKILFQSTRAGSFDLYLKTLGGSGTEELLLDTPNFKAANDWLEPAGLILYSEVIPKTNSDLWILSLKDKKRLAYLQTEFNEAQAQFSPDGKWIAYTSDETGRSEVYVQSYPISAGNKRQISTAGGQSPTWRKDQKEIFYTAANSGLMAVPVAVNGTLEAGVPVELFISHFSFNPISAGERAQYAVSADGQRFLLNRLSKTTSETPVHVILNWTELLKTSSRDQPGSQ